ncbi:Vacuolar protein sorting-associated protein 35, partial [Quaeritorhiza haematococci]
MVSSSSPNPEDQQKILEEALNVVKIQAYHMKKCLDAHKLMDALKHCSTMLSELRTSSLTPKNYYELYMAIFDELRHLTTYLYDAHMTQRHHLSDLYELVQYAGNIVPRLYLMITVGSVYMRVSKQTYPEGKPIKAAPAAAAPSAGTDAAALGPDGTPLEGNGAATAGSATEEQDEAKKDEEDVPPIKELMKDMLEMSRGVQHPTRGLFLRYYLSGMTRDYLPDGEIDGPHGTIDDSIQFILQNFIEMNKLWVRLQHQGHSREREKREQERKELRLLVGSNLVRLSQLEGLDLNVYKTIVLPNILEEIVSCKDVIAQEYLMEVIIQVFQDDFHLRTLDTFLSATAQLQRSVNVKQIVISIIDRFASYAARARDEANARRKAAIANEEEQSKTVGGIPEDVQLFEVFWGQITELVKARPEFTIQDVVALLVSLMNLSLNCYPEHLDYVDKVLGFAKERFLEAQKAKAPNLHSQQTATHILQLLVSPIHAYQHNILTLLQFPSSSVQRQSSSAGLDQSQQQSDAGAVSLAGHYTDLLFMQPFSTRRQVAHAVAQTCIKAGTLPLSTPTPSQSTSTSAPSSSTPAPSTPFKISTVEGVDVLFGELCSVMIREQKDGGLFGPKPVLPSDTGDELLGGSGRGSVASAGGGAKRSAMVDELPLDWEDVVEEQGLIARMVHLIKADEGDLDKEFLLLSTARKHFGEGGDIRIRFTLPPLVVGCAKLARKYKLRRDETG